MPAARFDDAESGQDFRGGYFSDRARADSLTGEAQQPFELGDGAVRLPFPPLLVRKLSGEGIESIGGSEDVRGPTNQAAAESFIA